MALYNLAVKSFRLESEVGVRAEGSGSEGCPFAEGSSLNSGNVPKPWLRCSESSDPPTCLQAGMPKAS